MADRWQAEETKIPDTVGLIISLLTDKTLNHRLLRVIEEKNFLRNKPEVWDDMISCVVKKSGMVDMLKTQAIPPDGNIGNVWDDLIEIDLVTSDDSILFYPPPGPGEEPATANLYEGAEHVLQVPAWIIHNIFSENRESYVDPDDSTFTIDDIQPASYTVIEGGYEGVTDLWAITLGYTISFEQEVRDA